ncbi:T9SS type A sorting domain-containing protein [Flavobacteriaceae bacterium]|nr:T9SS type A sorting domain-containing protein [Flavobacteriaceae bacterium]
MKELYFFCFLFIFRYGFSQTLIVADGSSITVNTNSSVSVDGFELAPSATYTVSGPNAFDRTSTPIVVGDNSSINRVYTMTELLSDYLGVVSFSYEESELNGISESDLVLEVQDAIGVWTDVLPIIDQTNNTLTYDFTELISFTTVTASSVNATLSVDPIKINDFVKVYPNPATDYLFIKSDLNYQSTLYNVAGQRVLESSSKQLNVIDLPTGVYLLQLKSEADTISTFKIIKK